MNEEEVYRALSSRSRVDILKLLYKKPHNIEELAEKLNLQPITIRHHIQSLQEAGLVEFYLERNGTVGRPKSYYRIPKSVPTVNFPKRRYLTLSSFLIDTLQLALGKESAKKILAQAGLEMGRDVVKQLEYESKIDKWTTKEFEELFVTKYLQEAGSEPEIIKRDDSKIRYRLHNCIFFELALKLPDLMCDTLHKKFHEGVTTAMGKNITDTQRTCMAHGADYCEHMVEWPSKKKS